MHGRALCGVNTCACELWRNFEMFVRVSEKEKDGDKKPSQWHVATGSTYGSGTCCIDTGCSSGTDTGCGSCYVGVHDRDDGFHIITATTWDSWKPSTNVRPVGGLGSCWDCTRNVPPACLSSLRTRASLCMDFCLLETLVQQNHQRSCCHVDRTVAAWT